jgi:hypothetical protein
MKDKNVLIMGALDGSVAGQSLRRLGSPVSMLVPEARQGLVDVSQGRRSLLPDPAPELYLTSHAQA